MDRTPAGSRTSGGEATDRFKRRLRVAAGLSAGALVILSMATSLHFWDVVGLAGFSVLLPALAVAQLPLLHGLRLERVEVYVGSGGTILAMGVVALFLGLRIEGAEGIGLSFPPAADGWRWTVGVTLAGLALIVATHPLDAISGWGRREFMIQLLPRTGREKGLFVVLSCAAGFGEELAYRGYVLLAFQHLGVGPWLAVTLSSVAFGILHAYQGPVGVLRTGIIGFVLALPVIITGSLLPSMVAHALIDLVAGLMLAPYMLRDGDTEGQAPRTNLDDGSLHTGTPLE